MFKIDNSILGNVYFDIMDTIENYDIYNSKFIHLLSHTIPEYSIIINSSEHRPDLINSIIGDYPENYGQLMIFNRFSIDELELGNVVNYLSEDDMSELIRKYQL